jgi:hypothetical protein
MSRQKLTPSGALRTLIAALREDYSITTSARASKRRQRQVALNRYAVIALQLED